MLRARVRLLSIPAALVVLALFAAPAAIPGAPPAITAHAAYTAYVCGFDDSNQTSQYNMAPCASSGTHCTAQQPQCWVAADITVHTGDFVDWEIGTGLHSMANDNTASTWPCNSCGGSSASVTFPDPGTYNYHCYYHHAMTGTVHVIPAPSPSPTPTPQATQTPQATPSPGSTPQPGPTPRPTHSSGGGGGGGPSTNPGTSPGSAQSPGSGGEATPLPGASPTPEVAINTSPSPATGGGGHQATSGGGSGDLFGISHFWVLVVVGILVFGAALVVVGIVMLIRSSGGPPAPESEA